MSTENLGYLIYAVAYGTSLLAIVMTRMLWLRLLFIVSSSAYTLYYFVFPIEPLWLDIITEGAFVALNIVMLCYVYWLSLRVQLSSNEQYIYDKHFSDLPIHEYSKLLKWANWQVLESGHRLIMDGEPVDHLYYLFSGSADVDTGDNTIVRSSGTVFGELSYRTSNPAKGSVTIADRSVVIAWDQQQLRKLCSSNERIGTAVDAFVALQMAGKIV